MGGPKGGAGGNGASISTVYITGFPPNANDRELENFCRFLPGFVGAKATMKNQWPRVWARFDTHSNAAEALPYVDGQPFDLQDPESLLRAELAKTETNPSTELRKEGVLCVNGPLDAVLGLTPSTQGRQDYPTWQEVPEPWYSSEEIDPTMDTLCVKSLEAKRISESYLYEVFGRLRGYVTMRVTKGAKSGGKGGGNAFVKFSSPRQAQQALGVGRKANLEVDMAKTSLNENAVDPAWKENFSWGSGAQEVRSSDGAEDGPSWKRARTDDGDGGMDTLIVQGLEEKGFGTEHMEEYFGSLPGFITLRLGKGRNNCFVKFDSHESAKAALNDAITDGFDSQMARTSLNVDKAPSTATSDTLVMMGVEEKGFSDDSLIEFFTQVEGFEALRYTQGSAKGRAGTCFVKFQSDDQAAAARDVSIDAGVKLEFARSRLNVDQATYVHGEP